LQRDHPAQRPPVKPYNHPGQRDDLCPGTRHRWQLASEVPAVSVSPMPDDVLT
jgi:hypothetical protein